MDASKFGKFISEQRKALGMTQADLGNKLMVTDKAVSKWERGLGFPDINTLEPLAEALQISVQELMRAEKNVTQAVNEEAVSEALRNTISVADKQLRDVEKRGIRIILGAVAVVVLLMLAIENMTLAEVGMAAFFVYLPLVSIVAVVVLLIWALTQKKRGGAYKRTLAWVALFASVIILIVIGLFIAGIMAFPMNS